MDIKSPSPDTKVNQILGYGKVLEVLTGADSNNNPIIKKYHFTPAPLFEIPSLMQKLDSFFKNTEQGEWNEQSMNECAELIKISLIKMHPDITIETIKRDFTLGGMAKAIRTVVDVSDFLAEVQEMNQMIQEVQSQKLMK